tara:strand:+ start:43 stop:378 length:336 start_codon:yes stop_codon:yes gene_type:complete
METTDLIKEVANSVRDLLIEKNITYGDSATNPKKIFSKGSSVDSLCARIDDKLSRIANKGITDKTEDTVTDLIGYLILLKVAMKKEYGCGKPWCGECDCEGYFDGWEKNIA